MGHKPDKDGVVRYSQWIPGASDTGRGDPPRSYWEKLLREDARHKAEARAEARPMSSGRLVPAIPSNATLGAPRPEFGVSARELARQLGEHPTRSQSTPSGEVVPPTSHPRDRLTQKKQAAPWGRLPMPDPKTKFKMTNSRTAALMIQGPDGPPFGIKLENGYPTYRPNDLQKQVIRDHLSARRMPIDQIDDLKFIPGLDKDAGFFTKRAFESGATAITQGNTVYVQPDQFLDVIGFKSETPFEEAMHSAQFAADRGAGFYSPYALGIAGGAISRTGTYEGIPYEAFAKGAAKEMYRSYVSRSKR